MRLVVLDRARNDLIGIQDYIATDSPPAAARVVATIEAKILGLREHPMLGRTGRVAGTRELVIAGTPYIAIYRLAAQRIEIVRVLHGAQRWP
ncbi:type II toxin-antitoxin system RelE/ParE family toxin [Oleomonas cavernae]|uniref:Type II toxin-antitoxin system RelE/ParE family toxin n=1 Tax=Oleomonas cavernae TaxID=2320859 RepID=A0A418WI55_9PROT|nr:type II toxin-antitoxin system RelE/ParE family toxin [Oleomonas cavernae]RJF89727.1 type II toxin-antitoxin system RelE/ParE family toxin [Oleomonas cavernae]